MPDYAAIATKVKDGLMRAGFSMTLTRETQGTYDPATGVYATGTSMDYTVTGLIQSKRVYVDSDVGQTFFNGTLVQSDDQFVILASDGLDIIPAPGDILTISGTPYTVVTMIPLHPGGTDLMYRVLARK